MQSPMQHSTQRTHSPLSWTLLIGLLLAVFLLPNHNISYLVMLGCMGGILLTPLLKNGLYTIGIVIVWCYVSFSTILVGVYDIDPAFVMKLVFISFMLLASFSATQPYVFGELQESHFRFLQIGIIALCGILLISQFVLIFKIAPFNSFILDVYMKGDVFASLYKGEMRIGTERSGGLFINPNQLAKAFSFLLVMAGIALSCGKRASSQLFYITFALIAVGVFLSGSRTGLIAIAFIFMLWNIKFITPGKIALFFIGVTGVVFLQGMFSDSRVFSTDSNAVSSLFYKLNYTAAYLHQASFLEMVFGHGINSYHQATETIVVAGLNFGFDADIGYSIFHFGIIGTCGFVFYLFLLRYRFDVPAYVYGVLLWVITSSIFFNIRGIATMAAIFLLLNIKTTWENQNLEQKA